MICLIEYYLSIAFVPETPFNRSGTSKKKNKEREEDPERNYNWCGTMNISFFFLVHMPIDLKQTEQQKKACSSAFYYLPLLFFSHSMPSRRIEADDAQYFCLFITFLLVIVASCEKLNSIQKILMPSLRCAHTLLNAWHARWNERKKVYVFVGMHTIGWYNTFWRAFHKLSSSTILHGVHECNLCAGDAQNESLQMTDHSTMTNAIFLFHSKCHFHHFQRWFQTMWKLCYGSHNSFLTNVYYESIRENDQKNEFHHLKQIFRSNKANWALKLNTENSEWERKKRRNKMFFKQLINYVYIIESIHIDVYIYIIYRREEKKKCWRIRSVCNTSIYKHLCILIVILITDVCPCPCSYIYIHIYIILFNISIFVSPVFRIGILNNINSFYFSHGSLCSMPILYAFCIFHII